MSPSAPPSSPPPKRRLVRVAGSRSSATPTRRESPLPPLPPDSLAASLLAGARAVAAVREGKSLGEALQALAGQPAEVRAAAQDVAYGTLRRHGLGDFVLSRLLQKPLTHGETTALLLAALFRLETRPDSPHTVVDQAVAAAAHLAAGAFKGLVNGVLRNYLRQRETLLAAAAKDEEARWQHPRWWLSRLRRTYPDRWEAIAAAGNLQAPMTLRVNRRRLPREGYALRLAEAGIAARPVGESGLLLQRAVGVDALPGFADGWVSVQDAGAQRAAELLDPPAGARVLDACAAPGGKTAHLLERGDCELLALDIDPLRVRRIGENLARLGLTAEVRTADCAQPADWWDGRPFDAILADVPCSASGVVRRHPDAKCLRRESDIRAFARTQAVILDALWPLLRPGGRLLYATCSVFSEENRGQIDAFLVRQPGAERLVEEQLLPQEAHDGFYYALLRKPA